MSSTTRRVIALGLAILYIAALLLPLYVFFHERGGSAWLSATDFKTSLQLLFPLLGLYAFTFVAWQVLIATNLRWLRQIWPKILNFHRFQGGFALLFATLHPTFIVVGFGLSNYLSRSFLPASLRWWLLPAYAALTIMLATTATALLAWWGRNVPWWRKLHRLNYLVFILVWLHSWFIGSDVRASGLRFIWLTYLLLIVFSIFSRYAGRLLTKK